MILRTLLGLLLNHIYGLEARTNIYAPSHGVSEVSVGGHAYIYKHWLIRRTFSTCTNIGLLGGHSLPVQVLAP